MIVPNEVNFSNIQGALSNGTTSYDVYVSPINGSSFSVSTGGQQIRLELPNSDGFIDPKSISYKFKSQLTCASKSRMRAVPLYSPFVRLETYIDGQSREIIQDWNVVNHMSINTTMNIAEKYGSPSLGFRADNDNVQNLETAGDGRFCDVNEVASFSGPLKTNILSSCERFIPMLAMGTNNALIFTLDTLQNIFAPAVSTAVAADPANGILAQSITAIPTEMIISDFVVSYTVLKFSPEMTSALLSQGPIFLKSQSAVVTSTNLNANTSGTTDLIFSQKMASVKSMFLHCSGSSTNGKFDSFNILGATGDVQFNIGSKFIPNRPLSMAVGNRAHLLTSLKMAVGSLYDRTNSFSINTGEYFKDLATGSTLVSPGKAYLGVNCEILPSNTVLLSGINTENTTIGVRLTLPTPLATNVNVSLISFCDIVLEIDPVERTTTVRK